MTETRTAVDKGSHEENSVVIIFLGSRERMIYGGMVMFRDLVIFSRRAGSLPTLGYFCHEYSGSINVIPFTLSPACRSFVRSPNAVQY